MDKTPTDLRHQANIIRIMLWLAVVAAVTFILWRGQHAFSSPPAEGSSTIVFICRHADRPGSDDDITATGRARAQELVHVLGQAGYFGHLPLEDRAHPQDSDADGGTSRADPDRV